MIYSDLNFTKLLEAVHRILIRNVDGGFVSSFQRNEFDPKSHLPLGFNKIFFKLHSVQAFFFSSSMRQQPINFLYGRFSDKDELD